MPPDGDGSFRAGGDPDQPQASNASISWGRPTAICAWRRAIRRTICLPWCAEDLRAKLRSAIQQASEANARIVVAGGRTKEDGHAISFNIDVRPVVERRRGPAVDLFRRRAASRDRIGDRPVAHGDLPRVTELEQELEATRTELQGAIRNLEISDEEQKAINEEALSVNEEFQSTNEELETSKEELQSLNEELTALNSQLQETLERQRTTSNDLQNILYSTDVATIFLDTKLNIRFFTPATKSLFNVIPGDIGRPLADLNSLGRRRRAADRRPSGAEDPAPIEREIEAHGGAWYIRRDPALPHPGRRRRRRRHHLRRHHRAATHGGRAGAAPSARRSRRTSRNRASSRPRATIFASRCKRSSLLQGLLAKAVEGDKAQKLVARLDETLGAMSGMLNTLLDINQIEAGTVHAEIADFPINDLLERLRDEFTYHAQGAAA